MSNNWPKVKLSDVLKPIIREVRVEATNEYRLLGVRLEGQGPFLRETVIGAQISATKLSRVCAEDFIYSRLFAWRGAFGVIKPELDGCYVSGEFPTFVSRNGEIDVQFLRHWFRLRSTLARVEEDCTGSTPLTRNRFKEQFFLALEIPLPPLAEQRRIVGRIEELATKIEEARGLRQQAVEEAEAIWATSLRSAFLDCPTEEVALEQVCTAIIDNLHSNPLYSDTGVPCVRSPDVGWGTLNLETALRTDETEYRRRTIRGKPEPDDIILVREGGGTGKAALVAPNQRFSLGQRVMMLRPEKKRVLPRFFLYQLLSPLIQEDQIGRLSKGSASPHLNIGALRKFPLKVPPLSEQSRIVTYLDELQAKVDEVKKAQIETSAELDALMPSILDKGFRGELLLETEELASATEA